MASIINLEGLEAYRAAREMRREFSRFCRTLPKEETYRLKDQIVRSTRSVTANIAEGFGRHHHQENSQFCRQARGSLVETLDHVSVALDENYLDEEAYEKLRGLIEHAWKVLNGYIAYLQRCAREGVPNPDARGAEKSSQQLGNQATRQPATIGP